MSHSEGISTLVLKVKLTYSRGSICMHAQKCRWVTSYDKGGGSATPRPKLVSKT